MKRCFPIAIFLMFVFCSCSHKSEKDVINRSLLLSELEELDQVLEQRETFVRIKLDSIDRLKEQLRYAIDYESRKNILNSLYNAYNPYQFDSAVYYLQSARSLAELRHDTDEVNRQNIRLGNLYVKAGYYMDAYDLLFNYVDSESLDPAIRRSWYQAAYSLASNISENSTSNEGFGRLQNSAVYRDSLLAFYSPGAARWNVNMMLKLLDSGQFNEARRINHKLMEDYADAHSEMSALYAYYETVICDSLGLASEKLYWEIQSAKMDIRHATKDYASLSLIAQDIMDRDIDRAFNYMKISLNDATFYNTRLRPWQISRYMMVIQDSYNRKNEEYGIAQRRKAMLLSVLVLFLSMLLVALFIFYRKLGKSKREVESLNLQVKKDNAELSLLNEEMNDANRIKENYITLCLSMISENINKMKDLSNKVIKSIKYGKQDELMHEMTTSTMLEDELKMFYETFDTTFLAMYPDFVEKFNELLADDAKCYPSKGDKLNTALRIFALVRLGIEDSDEIASLLKCSVRTVYNNKVKIRNSSKYPRNEFDAMLKKTV